MKGKPSFPHTITAIGAVRSISLTIVLILAALVASAATTSASDGGGKEPAAVPLTLEGARLAMRNWMETQQVISKERKEWQQGKDVLVGRLELVKNEIANLTKVIQENASKVAEAEKKRTDLNAEYDLLKAATAQLTEAITAGETELRRLFKILPEPVAKRLEPLYKRIPEDPEKSRVALAERFQNVLGILNDVNKANTEITVAYEVHTLADGKPSEVQVMYVGLTQAYYVSSGGEAGIGRPAADGWKWEPTKAIAGDVHNALEILLGKQSPAFVPLPVRLK